MPFRKLIEGFGNFQKNCFESRPELFEKLIRHGQSPEALIISCSDSRIDPAILTASDPGDLFVVRNVAAIVPPYEENSGYHGTSAAIEYAVKVLKVKNIIVMGHALCGGVRALLERKKTEDSFDFVGPWIGIGNAALEAVRSELSDMPDDIKLRALEQSLILVSLHNLLSFPWVAREVEAGRIDLHGWYFDIGAGILEAYDAKDCRFVNILTSGGVISPKSADDLNLEALARHFAA